MLPIIMAACGAAGAVIGALTTQAANEKDKQAVKRYEKVNTELINSRDKLQQRYYELSNRSQKQIKDLNLKLAESEMEKDLVYLALNLYHELMALREDIDINPSFEVLVEFHKAIVLTNYVLQQLDKRIVPVTQDYFSRTLTRIDERDNLSKEQLFSFMAVLMNPQHDTVTSLLGEVQNGMFSQQYTDVKQQNYSFDKTTTIEPDNQKYQKLQDEKVSQIPNEISLEQFAVEKENAITSIFDTVKGIVVDQLEVEADRVTPEASFTYDLGADSLDAVELIMALEEEFDIEIPDEVAEQIDTVGKAVKLIEYIEVAGEDDFLNQTITIESDNEECQESQNEKSSQILHWGAGLVLGVVSVGGILGALFEELD